MELAVDLGCKCSARHASDSERLQPEGRSSLASMGTAERTAPPRPHVVLIASPGAGHLIPMAELARRLVTNHGLAATLVSLTDLSAPDAHSAIHSSLSAADVATAVLPAVPLDDLATDARIETKLLESIRRSVPHLHALLRDISSTAPLAALVPDFFGSMLLPLAAELGVPAYLFFTGNLTMLALMRSAVERNDGAASGEYRDLPDALHLPGDVWLRREDYGDGFQSSKEPVYAHLIEEGRRYRAAAGFLVNTFDEIEPGYMEGLTKKAAQEGTFPPVYPVGPFVRPSSDEDGASACLDWLDRQPTGSVVYVSFGSTGALSVEQTAELAAGLEDSGHRFLWVVRMPSLDGENSDWGKGHRGAEDDPLAWLPEGFLERTSGRGLAVASWTPQVRVLSHPATAAFVSHGGWNSTIESMSAGVPMVVWPLYAEQRLNAAVLSENVGVALWPRATRADGLILREEIAAAVRELMGGEEKKGRAVRRRAGDLQRALARACAPGGSSWQMLEEIAGKWKAPATLDMQAEAVEDTCKRNDM